jgi:hypothetical protein
MENKEYNNLNYGGGFTEEDIKRVSLFEQAANNWIKSTSEFLSVKNGFKAGAKWQQERMYSEEEAKTIWRSGQEYWKTSGESITFEELIEQFKKK